MINRHSSELIVNPDNSIYHLHLKPEHVPNHIITVGDPGRVSMVSKYFDQKYGSFGHREFQSCFGRIGAYDVLVISTGIGTDNIDIVLNELDALVNIDLETGLPKTHLKALNIMRIGTSGAVRADIPVDTILVSDFALSVDGLMPYYSYHNQNTEERKVLEQIRGWNIPWPIEPMVFGANNVLLSQFCGTDFVHGITLTAAGFYAPQGRLLRYDSPMSDILQTLMKGDFSHPVTNIEMETAGIYGLGKVLGHGCISINAILANRATGVFSQHSYQTIDHAIRLSLEAFFD